MRHPPAPLVAAWAALALSVVALPAAAEAPGGAEDDVGFKVVVPADHPATSTTRDALAHVFLLRIRDWDDGTAAKPVDQEAESPVRQAFTLAIHGKSVTSIDSFWQRTVYAGRAAPPPVVASDEEVLGYLLGEPGAVGYVSVATPLDSRFRVLEVEGVPGYDAAALAGCGAAREAVPGDVTVAEHGDLRLFLTGSCGPAGEGRQAVLENANPHAGVAAVIETSVWADGWFRASSVRRIALPPLDEERLGCTHRDDGERRYAIVEASNASSLRAAASDLGHGPESPARDAVAIVGAGTCGSGRMGERQAVINRHPWNRIAVSIETREMVGDTVRRRYQKRYRLGPGDTRSLGCSADGTMVRRFTLLEAEYLR